MAGDPKLVPGRPDQISVWFLGARRIIDRAWYDHVMTLAHMPEEVVKQYLEKRRGNT